MTARVAPVDDHDKAAWTCFVDEHPRAGAMHDFGWRQVLENAFSVTPVFVAAKSRTGEVTAVVGAYKARSVFAGHYMATLEDGILYRDDAAYDAVLGCLQDMAAAEGIPRLCIRNARDCEGPGFETIHADVSLRPSVSELWNGIGKNTQRKVKQARNEGYTVRCEAPLSHLSAFYGLYARRMRDLGTPVIPYAMFDQIARAFGPETAKLHLVQQGDDLVGGMICFVDGGAWTNLFVAVPPHLGGANANALLYWEAIGLARERGAGSFRLGRSQKDSSTLAFKRKWRPDERPVFNSLYGDGGPNAHTPLYGAVWKRLPLWVANAAGPLLRQKLPFG